MRLLAPGVTTLHASDAIMMMVKGPGASAPGVYFEEKLKAEVTMDGVLIYTFISIFIAIIVGLIAKKKGRNAWLWGLFGYAFPVVMLLIVLFMKDKAVEYRTEESDRKAQTAAASSAAAKQGVQASSGAGQGTETAAGRGTGKAAGQGTGKAAGRSKVPPEQTSHREATLEEIWAAEEKTLRCLGMLEQRYDFIELVGGCESISGNSHDEAWEENYYLKDPKYKETFDVSNKIRKFDEQYAGWGAAYLEITDKIPRRLDDYYVRVKDKFFVLDDHDWRTIAEEGRFSERTDPGIKAVIELLEAYNISTPSTDEENEIFMSYCDRCLYKRGVHNPYPEYTLDYILACDNEAMKAEGMSVWHDISEHQYRLTVRLEDTRYWYLSVFIGEDGSFKTFYLDHEAANDSHYGFTDEYTVRQRIYKEGDEKLYLHDVFRRYISENDGDALLHKIPVTASFHY